MCRGGCRKARPGRPFSRRYAAVFTSGAPALAAGADLNSRAAIMRRFAEHEGAGRRVVLLYCGDHDPGGLQISEFLRSNLADLAGAVGWDPQNLIIDRFGLNADFIETNGLPWIENLETSGGGRLDDPRHRDHRKPYVQDYLRAFGARKVEANALVVRATEGRTSSRKPSRNHVPPWTLSHGPCEPTHCSS